MFLPAIYDRLNMTPSEVKTHPRLLISAFDRDFRVLVWNDQSVHYFGIAEQAALGQVITELWPRLLTNGKLQYLLRAMVQGKTIRILNDRFDLKEGEYEQLVLPIRDASGNVMAIVNVVDPK